MVSSVMDNTNVARRENTHTNLTGSVEITSTILWTRNPKQTSVLCDLIKISSVGPAP